MGDVQASHSADCQEETCQPWQHPREFVEVIIHYKYTNDKVEGHKRFERKGNFFNLNFFLFCIDHSLGKYLDYQSL